MKQLQALTMERRLAAQRLANIAGKGTSQPDTNAAKPKPKNGKAMSHTQPVLSLKTQ